MIVTPLHRYYFEGHLAYVISQMRELGPPTLRGYFDDVSGAWLLREGTHRIRAAHSLGLTPELVPILWWRSRTSLSRARYAAKSYGLDFECVRRLTNEWVRNP